MTQDLSPALCRMRLPLERHLITKHTLLGLQEPPHMPQPLFLSTTRAGLLLFLLPFTSLLGARETGALLFRDLAHLTRADGRATSGLVPLPVDDVLEVSRIHPGQQNRRSNSLRSHHPHFNRSVATLQSRTFSTSSGGYLNPSVGFQEGDPRRRALPSTAFQLRERTGLVRACLLSVS